MKLTFTPVPTPKTYFRTVKTGDIFYHPVGTMNKFMCTNAAGSAVYLDGATYEIGTLVPFAPDYEVSRTPNEKRPDDKKEFKDLQVGTFFRYLPYSAIWMKLGYGVEKGNRNAVLIDGEYGYTRSFVPGDIKEFGPTNFCEVYTVTKEN